MLAFDHETHTYRWEGAIIPSVTQVLKVISDFDMIPKDKLAYAAARGDAVHYGCELHDKGCLDWSTVDEELVPYIKAWISFREQTGFVPDLIEHRMFHPVMRYAGTLDRTGILFGKPAVIDIKAVVATYPSTGPQLAAYEALLKATQPDGPKQYARHAVQLKPDGKYKVHTYEDRMDFSIFVSTMTLLKWANINKQRITYEPE